MLLLAVAVLAVATALPTVGVVATVPPMVGVVAIVHTKEEAVEVMVVVEVVVVATIINNTKAVHPVMTQTGAPPPKEVVGMDAETVFPLLTKISRAKSAPYMGIHPMSAGGGTVMMTMMMTLTMKKRMLISLPMEWTQTGIMIQVLPIISRAN
jgi:hypothetical protein